MTPDLMSPVGYLIVDGLLKLIVGFVLGVVANVLFEFIVDKGYLVDNSGY